jgi:uncharacterized cysteine cluster protein YcgN (CxxCxxCC family)
MKNKVKRTLFNKIKNYFLKKQADWEKVCLHCGICCYEKEDDNCVIVINLKKPCEYLNVKRKLCTIYENRFKICKNCKKVTIFHALFSRCLPFTCGYVQKYRKFYLFPPPKIG